MTKNKARETVIRRSNKEAWDEAGKFCETVESVYRDENQHRPQDDSIADPGGLLTAIKPTNAQGLRAVELGAEKMLHSLVGLVQDEIGSDGAGGRVEPDPGLANVCSRICRAANVAGDEAFWTTVTAMRATERFGGEDSGGGKAAAELALDERRRIAVHGACHAIESTRHTLCNSIDRLVQAYDMVNLSSAALSGGMETACPERIFLTPVRRTARNVFNSALKQLHRDLAKHHRETQEAREAARQQSREARLTGCQNTPEPPTSAGTREPGQPTPVQKPVCRSAPQFCTATIEDASLIYDAHKKGRAGCISDWQPFRVEFCRCPSGMVNRSKERAMITASDDWKYGRSHSTVHLPGGGYESPY